jgi:hypothetical protein
MVGMPMIYLPNPSLLEVIAKPIAQLKYGDEVTVSINPDEIEIETARSD